MQTAVFGGGCFWCTEAVSSGETRHAEATYIEYDPRKVKYHDLLTVFFASHDPTTVNQQGNDIGPQYRSIIFYTTEEQKTEAERFIKELGAVTELEPLKEFYEAENYHKDYYDSHKDAPYCQIIINPKLEKVQKESADLLELNT